MILEDSEDKENYIAWISHNSEEIRNYKLILVTKIPIWGVDTTGIESKSIVYTLNISQG